MFTRSKTRRYEYHSDQIKGQYHISNTPSNIVWAIKISHADLGELNRGSQEDGEDGGAFGRVSLR